MSSVMLGYLKHNDNSDLSRCPEHLMIRSRHIEYARLTDPPMIVYPEYPCRIFNTGTSVAVAVCTLVWPQKVHIRGCTSSVAFYFLNALDFKCSKVITRT